MDYHHHARLTLAGREGLAKSVLESGLNRQRTGKWIKRYRQGGVEALLTLTELQLSDMISFETAVRIEFVE